MGPLFPLTVPLSGLSGLVSQRIAEDELWEQRGERGEMQHAGLRPRRWCLCKQMLHATAKPALAADAKVAAGLAPCLSGLVASCRSVLSRRWEIGGEEQRKGKKPGLQRIAPIACRRGTRATRPWEQRRAPNILARTGRREHTEHTEHTEYTKHTHRGPLQGHKRTVFHVSRSEGYQIVSRPRRRQGITGKGSAGLQKYEYMILSLLLSGWISFTERVLPQAEIDSIEGLALTRDGLRPTAPP